MTPRERLVTVQEGATVEEGKALIHKHRLERVLVVNDAFELRGLITVKDIIKGVKHFQSVLTYRDGSFIKMRSINLGYTLSSDLLRKAGLSSARIYDNATNPFIIYSPLVKSGLAIDPEGNGTGNGIGDGVPARQINVNLNTPPVRQFTLGLNVKF